MRKFEEAKQFKGPKMFLASSPCPAGWQFDPRENTAPNEAPGRLRAFSVEESH